MMLQIFYLIRRATRWILRNRKKNLDIALLIKNFAPSIQDITKALPRLLTNSDKDNFDLMAHHLIEQKVPEKLAKKVVATNFMFSALDIVESAKKYKLDLLDVAKTYYLISSRLELTTIRELIHGYVVQNPWDELARAGFRDDLDRVQSKLSARILTMKIRDAEIDTIEERIDYWFERNQALIERWQKLLADIKSSESASFVAYSVILRELFDFIQAA